jgi:hypothetical protein
LPRPRRPSEALLLVALREVPNDFEKSRPSGPGAAPPARWPTPSVRSTPRWGQLDRRGRRKASTSNATQTPTMIAMVMAGGYPCFPLLKTGYTGGMNERDPDDLLAEREADAAAHEAAGVGGRAPEDEDPERRPVDEAGGGEAEGFEQAEADLRENAEHGTLGPRDPNRDAFTGETESDRADSEYAEPDEARTPDRPDQG